MTLGTKLGRHAVDVAIIALAALLVGTLVQRERHLDRRPRASIPALRPGETVRLAHVNWADTEETLLLCLSDGCPYCQASEPFYRNLSHYASSRARHIRLLAIFPQPQRESRAYLGRAGITVGGLIQAELPTIGVYNTPTLVLLDRRGVVAGLWVGELLPEQQRDVWSSLVRGPTAASASSESPAYLTRGEFARLRASGTDLQLLDIRERRAYASGHRTGAINIPWDEVQARAPMELSRNLLTVVDCENTQPSYCESAAGTLRHDGFLRIAIMGDGTGEP